MSAPAQDPMVLIQQIIDNNNKTAGRDKAYRLVTFGAKAIAYYMEQYSPESKDTIQRMKKLSEAVQLSRRLFRIGKPIDFAVSCAKANDGDPMLRALKQGNSVGMGIWLIYDHILWATKVGLYKGDAADAAKKSSYAWVFGLLCGIFKNLHIMHLNQEKLTALLQGNRPSTQEELDTYNKNLAHYRDVQFKEILDLVKNVLDLGIPLTTLQYVSFTSGRVGLIGVITSIIGWYQIWPAPKVAAKKSA
eukprot:Clim_evm85s128 gene=Clim_evmTU85s128